MKTLKSIQILCMLTIAMIISSCSSCDIPNPESQISLMGSDFVDLTIHAEHVRYCNDGYQYEIHVSKDDLSFTLITDDVLNGTWVAIYDFESNISCNDGLIAPYDNNMIGSISEDNNTININGSIGFECKQNDGGWLPIDATLQIDLYDVTVIY